MSLRRPQAAPDKRDQLARIVDVAYSERSPEQRDRIYQWILRAPPSEVRRIEKLANERAQEAFRQWERERENEVWEQFENDPDQTFVYSRFVCLLTGKAFFYLWIYFGKGKSGHFSGYVIEGKPDSDPAQLAQRIRESVKAFEKFDAAEMESPDIFPLLH